MLLFLIRHAEAEPLGGPIVRDFDRPLTARGRHQVRALATALADRHIVIDAVAASPLVRAHQTAAELVGVLDPSVRPVTCDELAVGRLKPGKLSALLAELTPRGARTPDRAEKVVAAVGHMPDLGAYLEWLIGAGPGTIHFAKAAVACVRFKGQPDRATGELLWLVTPDWFM
jgi:phosphohistidine phosphatase